MRTLKPRNLATSRLEQGWIRCPRCRELFKHRHRCHAAIGVTAPPVPMTRRPGDFEDQVQQARVEAIADAALDAAAGEQLTIDVLLAACVDCGSHDRAVDEDSKRCARCMARAALAEAVLDDVLGVDDEDAQRAPP